MLIEENALKYWIDNFYGYGSWQAKFWFIGYEESGGAYLGSRLLKNVTFSTIQLIVTIMLIMLSLGIGLGLV